MRGAREVRRAEGGSWRRDGKARVSVPRRPPEKSVVERRGVSCSGAATVLSAD